MNRGILLAFLLISSLVTVESGLGRSLKKRLKSIGRPFAKAAVAVVGRRKRSADEEVYGNLKESSLTGWKQWDDKY
ncbi:hypothetical protein NECAME_07801 [Necator americanus]|uniref:Uncharacterized protein n=1 Tax=Necator americanus TaxID=51031 RepID=W2TNV3_NECAM|nr:hypothetical protein NECAME_07801 [Necator americanus]ETN82796.1 hypothetical protein NECAME_07801 [Necator americanus]